MKNNIIKCDYLRYRDNYTIFNSMKLFLADKAFRYTVLMRLYITYANNDQSIRSFCVKVLKN